MVQCRTMIRSPLSIYQRLCRQPPPQNCFLFHQGMSSSLRTKHPEMKACELKLCEGKLSIERSVNDNPWLSSESDTRDVPISFQRCLAATITTLLFYLSFTFKAPKVRFPWSPGLLVPWLCTQVWASYCSTFIL